MLQEKKCLDCNEIIRGRADKKFCNDQCRNNYNNQLNSDTSSLVRNVNNILRKNRRILEELNPAGKIKMNKAKLVKAGFDLQYHTHQLQTQNGNTYIFCYEYGYLVLDNETFLLVKREENA
jgi:hypothetical protein